MALATITGNRSDIAGLPDKGDLWFKPTTPTADVLSLRRKKAVIDEDGDFTIQLQPGVAEVTIFNKAVKFEVPSDGGTYTLWSRIAAAIALPPETSQSKLNAAIAQVIDSGATELLTVPVADATYAPIGAVDPTALYKQLARTPEVLIAGSITRDVNGAATSAPVAWPDGTVGTYTATTLSSAFPGAVDAYTITYGSPVTHTYTQPAVTRDASGAATAVPAIVVS